MVVWEKKLVVVGWGRRVAVFSRINPASGDLEFGEGVVR